MSRHHLSLALLPALFVMGSLTACGPIAPAADTGSDDTSSESEDDASTDDGDDGFSGVTVSGTGSYAIPDQLPYGGYQLAGEADEQPAGCTWAILDADGAATFENQGQYVFITDIPEAVTFQTDGCPNWEQFE